MMYQSFRHGVEHSAKMIDILYSVFIAPGRYLFQHILKAVQFVPLYQLLYHIYFFPEIRVFARS